MLNMENYPAYTLYDKYIIFVDIYIYMYLPSNSELFVISQCKNVARLRPNSLFKFSTACSPRDCWISIKAIIYK